MTTTTEAPKVVRFNKFGAWPDGFALMLGGDHIRVTEGWGTWRNIADMDRYAFDFGLDRGWAQVDTDADASYYGHWTNPSRRQLLSYVEGDISLHTWETDDGYVEGVRRWIKWFRDVGHGGAIDPLLRLPLIEHFERLGLADLTH